MNFPLPEKTKTPAACRFCHAPLSYVMVEVGMSPPCEAFLIEDQLDDMEPHYPLRVWVCDQCFLVQIKTYVEPTSIFKDYAYFSSYSTSWIEHAREYSVLAQSKLSIGSHSLVVEVGSNDGYLLQHFASAGIPVLGIEPAANVAKAAIDRGVATRVAFFNNTLADELVASGVQADLIVVNNVLAQVPDLNDFVAGLARLVKPKGVITVEVPHLLRLMQDCQFDTIYHEHYSYFALGFLQLLAQKHNLRVIDVEELPTHGGSLRVYMAPASSGRRPSDPVAALVRREREYGLTQLATYGAFANDVMRIKRDLLSFLIAAKNQGKKVCGYGAPGKGNTLLNYCGIGPDLLTFTVDRNPHKHHCFTPGMHIPIFPVQALYEYKPDFILVLPWNLRDEIVSQLSDTNEWGAKLVVPIPKLEILEHGGAPT